jgi:hypothetical protein
VVNIETFGQYSSITCIKPYRLRSAIWFLNQRTIATRGLLQK